MSDCQQKVCEKGDPEKLYMSFNKNSIFDQDDDEDQDEERLPASYMDCPISRDALGYYTWNLLHTMAAYYPERPSLSEQQLMRGFIDGFSHFYPCKICRKDLKQELQSSPIKVENREDFAVSICNLHNDVNRKLGRQLFDCRIENLDLRWKDGYAHCKDKYKQ